MMTRTAFGTHLGLGLALITSLSTLAFAQPDPAARPMGDGPGQGERPPMRTLQQPGPPQAPLALEVIGDALFILDGQTLAKYKADTLAQVAIVKLGDEPAVREPGGEDGARRQPVGPPPLALLLASGTGAAAELLAIVGDNFYRIQVEDLKVAVKAALPKPPAPPRREEVGRGDGARGRGEEAGRGDGARGEEAGRGDGARGRGEEAGRGDGARGRGEEAVRGEGARGRGEVNAADGMPGGRPGGPGMAPPIVKLVGKTLFLIRGTQLLAINTTTGQVTAQGTTPTAPAAARVR
jgi:hypothetical protein